MNTLRTRTHLYLTYVLGIIFTLHMVLPVYINSTFLAQFITESKVGILYTIGSALTVLGILWMSRLLPRFGNNKTTLFLIGIEAVAVLFLAFSTVPILVYIAFFLHFILTTLISLNLDVFLEAFTNYKETGKIRGTYLTINNAAWVVGPLFAGLLAIGEDFSSVYLVSFLLLLPLAGLLFFFFRNFNDPEYELLTPSRSFAHVWSIRDLRYIFLANLVLRTFFAVMVVYTPLYLHQIIGLSFDEIGIILMVMLSAYILLEYPLGRIADTILGEKELLVGGFIVIAAFTGLLSFVLTESVLWWAVVLFMTRVGAAMVESMAETYFFKKVDEGDMTDLSIFRTTIPLGYVIAPFLATIFLAFFAMQWIFLATAIMVLLGAVFGLNIKDTR